MIKKNKYQRLNTVLHIAQKLKKCAISNNIENPYINLWDSNYPSVNKLKNIFNEYINQDDNNTISLIGYSGHLYCPEINKKIIYKLPINKHADSEFVLKTYN